MSKTDFSHLIDPQFLPAVYTQEYGKSKDLIDGVKLVNLKNIGGEEGSFSEILRLDDKGELELFPGFKLAQVNRTTQLGNTIKAWHLHGNQDEVWYVEPQYQIFVGLWDVRKDSPTKNQTNRIVLGAHNSQLLFIPRGVAHGSAVFTTGPANLYYYINQQFDPQNPDERRIAWDYLGSDFWLPERD